MSLSDVRLLPVLLLFAHGAEWRQIVSTSIFFLSFLFFTDCSEGYQKRRMLALYVLASALAEVISSA